MSIYLGARDFYPAVVSKLGPRFEARLVDMPNCIGIGQTPNEAEQKAATALAEHAAFRAKHDIEMPQPSTAVDRAIRDGDYIVYIELPSLAAGSPGSAGRIVPEADLRS